MKLSRKRNCCQRAQGERRGGSPTCAETHVGLPPRRSPCSVGTGFARSESVRRGGNIMKNDRRGFLLAAALGAASVPIVGRLARADDKDKKREPEEDISAPEDLMREHGVLNRILLIYEEGLRRLRAKEEVPPDVFSKPANLVRKFVEDYHEKLEENFIFPEFEKQKKLVDLVKTQREQHE